MKRNEVFNLQRIIFWHHNRLCSIKETLTWCRKRYKEEEVIKCYPVYVNGHVHVTNVGCIKHVRFSHFYLSLIYSIYLFCLKVPIHTKHFYPIKRWIRTHPFDPINPFLIFKRNFTWRHILKLPIRVTFQTFLTKKYQPYFICVRYFWASSPQIISM